MLWPIYVHYQENADFMWKSLRGLLIVDHLRAVTYRLHYWLDSGAEQRFDRDDDDSIPSATTLPRLQWC